jgi:hypothetical protein
MKEKSGERTIEEGWSQSDKVCSGTHHVRWQWECEDERNPAASCLAPLYRYLHKGPISHIFRGFAGSRARVRIFHTCYIFYPWAQSEIRTLTRGRKLKFVSSPYQVFTHEHAGNSRWVSSAVAAKRLCHCRMALLASGWVLMQYCIWFASGNSCPLPSIIPTHPLWSTSEQAHNTSGATAYRVSWMLPMSDW